jgi:DNA-binding MarR family transcriptional regulator
VKLKANRRFTGRRLKRTWQPISSPQHQLSYWVKLAETHFSKAFARELGRWNLIASEWAALREMYRPGRLSPLDLARAIGMTKGGASKLIVRLVAKGLVRKKVGKSDRRTRSINLTQPGRDLVPHLADLETAEEHNSYRRLPGIGRIRLIERLKRALGAERKGYLEHWITSDGNAGQWLFQDRWRRNLWTASLDDAALLASEQRLQLFWGQLAKSTAR